ncbi:4'-phosphopantetheinyl transferase superfamily protein [Kitasatospora sp. GP82]|uniref:4'-phosphopantetheinyl transferase family protein n=1 Tax=Kitasatospora sp. GP82 TaxID=3035089 RepID=UPI0024771D82|nr:4'-phosphopantetheinyl transferase superfamily protein [Kitasatospora sp. GP82]MDH6125068.1 4'-phosphopantetheinyl transferase [Kitasatospora sp. GP82]
MHSDTDRRGDGPLAVAAASAEVLRHPEAHEDLLTEIERVRAARFRHETTRQDFVAAHILVRLCAAQLLGVTAAEVTLAQSCPGCGKGDHGKPYLPGHPDVHVSLSHTKGVVAAAAGFGPVGVDVERAERDGPGQDVLERVLTEAELRLVREHAEPGWAFLRQWVRKEAMVKIGRATLDSMGALDLSALPLETVGGAPLSSRFEDLHLLDWDAPQYGATASVVSPQAPRLAGLVGLTGLGG